MFSKTISLSANVAQNIEFVYDSRVQRMNDFIIYNLGSENVYASIDEDAAIEGEGSVVCPPKSARGLGQGGYTLNLISSSNVKINIQGIM